MKNTLLTDLPHDDKRYYDKKTLVDSGAYMQPTLLSRSPWLIAISICVAAFLIRLISIGLYPLQDTSEARYGEMARLMVETNDWITVWFDHGVPFWGKPPLFVWLSALSFKLFGINEFAARFPSLLVSIGIVGFSLKLALFQMGQSAARLVLVILPTTAIFLILSGTVLADPVTLLSITMIIAGFWIGWHSQDAKQARQWQTLFFIGCAVALLAKGLAAVVLAGLPIFFWCLLNRRLITLWQRFPWIKGTLLTLAIAAPWYIAAELKTPGFLYYFIIGEHFDRYLDSGWAGDKYGAAHIEPLGTIWVYWLASAFPWSFLLIAKAIQWGKHFLKGQRSAISDWRFFLLLWLLCPLAFFSFAHNIIWTYVLPVIPALALLLADIGKEQWEKPPKWLLACSAIIPVFMIIATVYLMNSQQVKSQKILLSYVQQQHTPHDGIIYFLGTPFSGRFYSQGKALDAENIQALKQRVNQPDTHYYLATEGDDFKYIPEDIRQRFTQVAHHRHWTLYWEK